MSDPTHCRVGHAARARDGGERGIALGVVILSSLMFTAAAVAVLQLSMNSSVVSDTQEQRLQARYAAEAGLVWAMQRLWVNDDYCGAPDPPALNGCTIDITVTNCVTKVNRQVLAAANCP